MLRLITDQQVPENPTIGVRWCIDPKDKAKLLELKAANVHVLIVVAYANGAEDRHLCSLGDAMTYVMFRFPGTHTVFARLVWAEEFAKMEKYLLERSSRSNYQNHMLDHKRTGFRENIGNQYYEEDEKRHFIDQRYIEVEPFELNVEVGKEHFAKEWPDWVKWWVNLPYAYPPVDQCQFRERMPFAVLVQPFGVAFFLLVRNVFGFVYFALGLLLCARGLNLWPLVHPLEKEFADIWPKVLLEKTDGQKTPPWRRSAWIVENRRGKLKLHRLFVSPLLFAIVFGVLTFLRWRLEMDYLELIAFAAAWVAERIQAFIAWVDFDIVLGLLMMAAISGAITAVFIFLPYRLIARYYRKKAAEQEALESSPEYQEARRQEAEAARLRALQDAYRYLMCPMASEPALQVDVKALPPERRTLRLRFLALKRDICRSYAG